MTNEPSDLSFDKATYATKGAAASTSPPCGNCGRPFGDAYWKWYHMVICANCKPAMEATFARSQSMASFGKALALGGLTAFGLGAAYAVFVQVTNFQVALVTIGIAFLIAKVVRKASGNLSGVKYQVLALVLTYLAGTMGYLPSVLKGFARSHEDDKAGVEKGAAAHDPKVAPVAPSARLPDAPEAAPTHEAKSTSEAPPSALALLFGVVFLFVLTIGVTLIAPFLEITSAPLGVLIIGFGLWEAWKLTKPLSRTLEGPFHVPEPSPSAVPVEAESP